MQETESLSSGCTAAAPTRARLLDFSARDAAFWLLVAGLIACGSPALALVAGMIFAIAAGHPRAADGHKLSKALLQTCVVMLGFGMDLEQVLRAGAGGLGFAAFTIAATLGAGFWIGRRLGIGGRISALIAAGTAICGGSAIAAVGPVIAATEAEMGIAVGAIFLLNAAALVIFPPIGAALHLTQHQFGLWAGVGIHDISSVVGAATAYGDAALQTATAVKLSRALWIAPLTLGLGIALARKTGTHSGQKGGKGSVPWFIGLFLLASVARSVSPAVAAQAGWIGQAAKAGMVAALCLIGAGISPAVLRKLGWRVAMLAVVLWLFISTVALGIAVKWG